MYRNQYATRIRILSDNTEYRFLWTSALPTLQLTISQLLPGKVEWTTKNNIAKSIYYISLSKYIRANINNEKIINSIAKQNSVYSYELAKMLKLDIYDEKNDVNKLFISSLQSFGFPVGITNVGFL